MSAQEVEPESAVVDSTPLIPAFEGHPVDATAVRMSGAMPFEASLENVVIGVDDVVQMMCQFRCIGIGFDTDRNGKLVRVQVLRPIEMMLVPFDMDDPDDVGILKALPSFGLRERGQA